MTPLPTDVAAQLAKTVVVDESGAPLLVFRGEHGGDGEPSNLLQSRRTSLSFGSLKAANTYALDPNDHRDHPTAPRVIPAYLRIEKPFLNDPDEPFVDLAHVARALGDAHARRLAEKFERRITDTGSWLEGINDYYGSGAMHYASPRAFMDAHADRWDELYFDAYRLLDDAEEVALLGAAGFDGAIHAGNGETALETEYRVFDAGQVVFALAPEAALAAEVREPNSTRFWRLNTLAAHAADASTWTGFAPDDEEHARRERARAEAQQLRAREAAVVARYEQMRAVRATETEMARKGKKAEDPAFAAQRQQVVAEFTQAARELGVLPERAERAGEAIFQSFVVTSKRISDETDKTMRMLGEKVERQDPERRAVQWLIERSPETRRMTIVNNTRPYVALHMTDEQLGLAPREAEPKKPVGPFTVTLGHVPNPDLPGGYWVDPVDSRAPQRATAVTLREASAACRAYIERNDLGGGNWAGGEVFDAEQRRVARVSYNGRVWGLDGKEIALEDESPTLPMRAVWVVETVVDRGPSAGYRFAVTGTNLSNPGSPERFTWSVPSLLSESYDLSAVDPYLARAVVTVDRMDTAAFVDIGRSPELQAVIRQAGERAAAAIDKMAGSFELHDTNGEVVGRLGIEEGRVEQAVVPPLEGQARVVIDLGAATFHAGRRERLASVLGEVAQQLGSGELDFTVRDEHGTTIGVAMASPPRRELRREASAECEM